MATLLLADWPAVNSVTLAKDGTVRHIGGTGDGPTPAPGDRQLTYAGVGVFDRRVLANIGPGFSSLITPLVKAMAKDPAAVRGYAPSPLAWAKSPIQQTSRARNRYAEHRSTENRP